MSDNLSMYVRRKRTHEKAFMMRCSTSFSGRVVWAETSAKDSSRLPAGFRKMRSMRAMRQIFWRRKACWACKMG